VCRTSNQGSAVAVHNERVQRMLAALSDIEAALRELLASLPPDDAAAVSEEALARYEEVKLAQNQWEAEMAQLLDAVSKLQSPTKRRGLASRAQTVP
jgi:uncharacterized protein YukE